VDLGHNSPFSLFSQKKDDKVVAEESSRRPLETRDFERMARRRYQQGGLTLRGNKWKARWREDVIKDGVIKRVERWKTLGTKSEYPTRKLALAALADELQENKVNNRDYRPRQIATFAEFAHRWQRLILPTLKPSSQPPIRSQLCLHLIPELGAVEMKDLTNERLQLFVTDHKGSPKTVRNQIATLRIMWKSAKKWNYVGHDPFDGLVLPEWDEPEQPTFSPEDVKRIIDAAPPPYDTIFWLVAQTGIRRGEVCALDVGHVDLDNCVITVRRSRSGRYITNTKSRKPRVFSISPRLAERLQSFVKGHKADEPLFLTAEGNRLHPDNFVKRHLKPLLKQLKLEGGLHAFRHGNTTVQDRLGVPMAVRQARLGHVDSDTTMGYTHIVGDDDRKLVKQLDDLFCPSRILRAAACTKQKKALTPESQGLTVQ
jgi:integrase